jgi:hypothetical protein
MLVIDAINDMLAYIGETPLDAADPDYTAHPLYESALRVLNSSSRKVQARGWWFNHRRVDLTPVADAIAIPTGFLAVTVLNERDEYAVRGGMLYNLTQGTSTITAPIRVELREMIAFADLPETAAGYIAAHAASRFVRTYDGDPHKQREVEEDEAVAYALFNAEHIRNSKVNLFRLPNTASHLATSWYQRYLR